MVKRIKKEAVTRKLIDFNALCEIIKPGDRIFISSGPSTPVKTVRDIINTQHKNLYDLEFIQLTSVGDIFTTVNGETNKIRLKTFFVGENVSMAYRHGMIDFIPTNIAEIPFLFASGCIGVDLAIIQTSPIYGKGLLNLGIVNDLSRTVIKNASTVIAETNPNVPLTSGDTTVAAEDFDFFIHSDHPLLEIHFEPYDDILNRIAWHISNLIDSGSTISLGAGRIFNAIADHLKKKKGLRIWAHVISDWIIDLIASGAICSRGFFDSEAPVVATSSIGSRRLYEFLQGRRDVEFLPLLQSAFQARLPKLKNLVSVLNVNTIDISGDTVTISQDQYQVAGFDGKLNFSIAATHSRNGRSIVALRSTNRRGESNIVIRHRDGDGFMRSTLGSTHYVVTEFGVANIFGKSIRERAMAIIDISNPRHRQRLIDESKELGYIYPDQIYEIKKALKYPYHLESEQTFPSGLSVFFRPIKPSDEDMMRRLFYQFSDEAKRMRYFSPIRTMPHNRMQHYVNVDYEQTLSLVGVIQQRGVERIIAECRYVFTPSEKGYEMAFIVDEEYQGQGIATFMIEYLISIAQERGIKKLFAYVMPQNHTMIRILQKASIYPEIEDGDEYERKYVFYIPSELK